MNHADATRRVGLAAAAAQPCPVMSPHLRSCHSGNATLSVLQSRTCLSVGAIRKEIKLAFSVDSFSGCYAKTKQHCLHTFHLYTKPFAEASLFSLSLRLKPCLLLQRQQQPSSVLEKVQWFPRAATKSGPRRPQWRQASPVGKPQPPFAKFTLRASGLRSAKMSEQSREKCIRNRYDERESQRHFLFESLSVPPGESEGLPLRRCCYLLPIIIVLFLFPCRLR